MLLLHAEVCAPVADEHIEFFETAFVKQQRKTLPRGEFSFLVLGIDSLLATAQLGDGPALDQFLDVFLLDAHIFSMNILFCIYAILSAVWMPGESCKNKELLVK